MQRLRIASRAAISLRGVRNQTSPILAVRVLTFCVLALATLWGCSGEGGAERVPLDRNAGATSMIEPLPDALQERLDLANAAFRDRDYERALEHFQAVVHSAPELAAGWYGIGMTHAALGNIAAADSAMMRVHGLAPEVPLDHPSPAAPMNPHPAPQLHSDADDYR